LEKKRELHFELAGIHQAGEVDDHWQMRAVAMGAVSQYLLREILVIRKDRFPSRAGIMVEEAAQGRW
jgi:hypothetical protein